MNNQEEKLSEEWQAKQAEPVGRLSPDDINYYLELARKDDGPIGHGAVVIIDQLRKDLKKPDRRLERVAPGTFGLKNGIPAEPTDDEK